MLQFPSTILSNTRLSDAYHRLVFSWAPDAGKPMPGQFVTVRVGQGTSPLLRRPFALSGYDGKAGAAELIYTRRGPATEMLATVDRGDVVDVIGPLGNSLVGCRRAPEEGSQALDIARAPESEASSQKQEANQRSSDEMGRQPQEDGMPGDGAKAVVEGGMVIAVAGGTGLGPMVYWARYLKEQGVRARLVFGCRTAGMVPGEGILDGMDVVVCTDDGSRGFRGTTVDYLRSVEGEIGSDTVLCGCGPTPMLKGCHEIAVRHEIPCWVSLEQTMACGVGACMGCVVKVAPRQGPGTPGGGVVFARVCKEGPVFCSRDVVWT